jgi:hypothetical protein
MPLAYVLCAPKLIDTLPVKYLHPNPICVKVQRSPTGLSATAPSKEPFLIIPAMLVGDNWHILIS